MPHAFIQGHGLTDEVSNTMLNSGSWSYWLLYAEAPEVNIPGIFMMCAALYGVLAIGWISMSQMDLIKEGTTIHTAMVCATFSAMAIGMNVLNKSLVTALGAPCLITAIQMFSSVACLVALQWPKLMQIQSKHKTWLFIPLIFTGMLLSSLYTYQYMNLSMFTIVRNLAPMVCLPIEMAVMPAGKGPTVSLGMMASLAVMLGGAMAYGFDSTAMVSVAGLWCAVVNMVMGISDRLAQRRLLTEECRDLPTEACAFLNNFVGLIPSLILAGFIGEVSAVTGVKNAKWTDPQIVFLLILSCAIGLGISYFGLATQRAISATSVMVLQNMQRIGVILMGVVFFGDNILSWNAMLGVVLSIGGSVWYSKQQMDLKAAEAKESKPLAEEGKAKV